MTIFEKVHIGHNKCITDIEKKIFTPVTISLPPKASDKDYGQYVSKPLYFKTKRSLFSGYYHFGDNHFYCDVLTMHKDHRWFRRITGVTEWTLRPSENEKPFRGF